MYRHLGYRTGLSPVSHILSSLECPCSLTACLQDNAEADAISESKEEYNAPRPVNFTVEEHPPLEEQLLGSTLWPEVGGRKFFEASVRH